MLWAGTGWQILTNNNFSTEELECCCCTEAAAGYGAQLLMSIQEKICAEPELPGSALGTALAALEMALTKPFLSAVLAAGHSCYVPREERMLQAKFPSAWSWLCPSCSNEALMQKMPRSPTNTWTSCQEKYLEYLLPSMASHEGLHEQHPKVCFAENNICFAGWGCGCQSPQQGWAEPCSPCEPLSHRAALPAQPLLPSAAPLGQGCAPTFL